MPSSNQQNPNASYGRALMDMVGGIIPAFGDVHVVVSSSDTADTNYQKLGEVFKPANGQLRFFTSLSDAYTACATNNNDIILLDAHTSHTITPFVWSKSRIHVIGMDGGERMSDQRTKVVNSASDTAAYVLQVTGTGNSFRNIKFLQASTQGTALTCVQDGGADTLWKNCQFMFTVADNLGSTSAHEFLAGCDSNTFIKCTFGATTLLTTAARSVFHIDQISGFEFKNNYLEDCLFQISSSSSSAVFVKLDAVGDILFANLFKRCTFLASVDSAGGVALSVASFTGTSTVKGCLAYDQCSTFNTTDFATATSGGNAATQIVGISSTAGSSNVGVQPTA